MSMIETPSAIILGSNENAYFMHCALSRRGIQHIVLARQDRPTFRKGVISHLPASHSDSRAIVNSIAASTASRAVVIPSSDEYARILAEHKSLFPERLIVQVPSFDVTTLCANKDQFDKFCRSNQFLAPKSLTAASAEDLEKSIGEFRFPLIVKPVSFRALPRSIVQKVKLVESQEELSSLAKKIWDAKAVLFCQEYIPGDCESITFVGGFRLPTGVSTYFCGRKELEIPALGGSTTCCHLAWDDEAVTLARQILEAMDFVGMFDIEFKLDPGRNAYAVIEVNPRIGRWHRISETGDDDVISGFIRNAMSDVKAEADDERGFHEDGRLWIDRCHHLPACVEKFGVGSGMGRFLKDILRHPQVHDKGSFSLRRFVKCSRVSLGTIRERLRRDVLREQKP